MYASIINQLRLVYLCEKYKKGRANKMNIPKVDEEYPISSMYETPEVNSQLNECYWRSNFLQNSDQMERCNLIFLYTWSGFEENSITYQIWSRSVTQST